MPVTPTVQPGDLISAERWNLLLAQVTDLANQVQQLSGGVVTGTVTVPNLFGRTLAEASAIITQPALQLALGVVLDASGKVVNPQQQGMGQLLVLNQVPSAGTKTNPGASVQLVVAAVQGGEPQPVLLPRINLIVPATVAVGAQLEIRGENFESLASRNGVSFDGRAAVPTDLSTTTSLFVIVPTGIPGAPSAPGGPTKPNVEVIVTTSRGQARGTCNVSAPLSNQPTITGITNSGNPASPVRVGQNATIVGTNFGNVIGNIRVRFDGQPGDGAIPSSGTAGQLVVAVPTGIPGLETSPSSREAVPVVVTVGELVTPAFPVRVVRV